MKTLKLIFFIAGYTLFSQTKEKDSVNIESLSKVYINSIKSSGSKVVSGQIELGEKQIEEAPVVLGEKDLFKILQLTPGVQQGSEGQSGLLVRGGNSSMNHTYLDEIYLHNSSHLGGLFSLINSDFVQKITFNKASFDAAYGGRISSITNIKVKTNYDSLFVKGTIGIATSKITSGIPIPKLNTKVLISGRRTYLDVIQPIFSQTTGNKNSVLEEGKSYYFYDYLVKTSTHLNSKNQINLLYYQTKDNYYDKGGLSTSNSFWENKLYGFNWKTKLSKAIKHELFISKSNYQLYYQGDLFPVTANVNSFYNKTEIKNKLLIHKGKHLFKTGVSYENVKNLPKKINATIGNNPLEIPNQEQFEFDMYSLFVDDEYNLSEKLRLKYGLRYTIFKLKASSLFKNYNKGVVEPRLSFNYEFKEDQYLKFSYQNIVQFTHQSNIATYSTPIDFYIPSHQNLKPSKGTQLSLSYAKDLNFINFELAGYYKKISNYTEFLQGSINTLFLENIYQDVISGRLDSGGVELSSSFSLSNKLSGNLNYTFSRTFAKFQEINNNTYFPVIFDRPHNFNTILNYNWNEKLKLGANFIFTSGQNFTPPEQVRVVDDKIIISFANRNSLRYPSYHRLDVYANYLLKKTNRTNSTINFTIYNLYNRKNPFYIQYSLGDLSKGTEGVKTDIETLFPFFPSVSWVFSFK